MRTALTQVILGYIDFYKSPKLRVAWGGPFNGQSNRLQVFKSIIASVQPAAIIETGTHLGTTTEFMACTGLPTYTIEGHPRYYGFARARLWRRRNVKILRGDSRAELKRLFEGPLSGRGNTPLFCYLDAHWGEDLPLAEEIDIIFALSYNAVVMIDDFQVPDDPGYGFDSYGPEKSLNAEYIAPLLKAHGLRSYYPAAPSSEEVGERRGCVVLCKTTVLGAKLETLPLLRRP